MIKRRGRGSGSRGTRLNYGNAGCSGYISGAEAGMKGVGHLVFENLRNLGPGASGAWMVFFFIVILKMEEKRNEKGFKSDF